MRGLQFGDMRSDESEDSIHFLHVQEY